VNGGRVHPQSSHGETSACEDGVFVSSRPRHGQMFEDYSSNMDVAQVVCLVEPQHGIVWP